VEQTKNQSIENNLFLWRWFNPFSTRFTKYKL